MNSKLIISVAVPVVAFVTVVGYSWVQRPAAAPSTRASVQTATATAVATRTPIVIAPIPSAPPAPAPTTAVGPSETATTQPMTTVAGAVFGAPASTATGGSDANAAQVPVILAAHARGGDENLIATVQSMSTDTLELRVTDVNAKTHLRSVVDVSVRSHERKNLTEAGLQVMSGDQVTVRSPPFQDLIVQLR